MMNEASKTPRVDAEISSKPYFAKDTVPTQFARQLETELNEAKSVLMLERFKVMEFESSSSILRMERDQAIAQRNALLSQLQLIMEEAKSNGGNPAKARLFNCGIRAEQAIASIESITAIKEEN